jgi:drug/metabolite transporter (DMT)-like permease
MSSSPSPAQRNREQESGPALWMLSSALSFSLMSVFVKAVGERIPVAEVVLARSLVSLVLSVLMLRQAGLSPWGNRRWLLVLRGVIGTGALLCVFAALEQLPLAPATVLQYLQPTITALLAWLLLKERLGGRIILAALLGWLAVVLLSSPAELSGLLGPLAGTLLGHSSMPLPLTGVLLALGGAVLSACAYVSVRALGRSEHPLVIVFYFPLVGLVLTLPAVIAEPVLPSMREALALVGVGLFTQLGQIGVTRGLLRLPAARATAMSYGQVPLAALWGWCFFREPLDPDTAMAALLVLAATLLSLRRAPQPAATDR